MKGFLTMKNFDKMFNRGDRSNRHEHLDKVPIPNFSRNTARRNEICEQISGKVEKAKDGIDLAERLKEKDIKDVFDTSINRLIDTVEDVKKWLKKYKGDYLELPEQDYKN